MEILKIENMTFYYPLCRKAAIEGVSFSLSKGEFAVLCGETGSGKSTLMRLLKRELAPKGERSGVIYYKEKRIEELSVRESACRIGFVMQDPEHQMVCDKVWHELAFGLENMGLPREVIARRVAEMASYFGIETWYDKNVSELSGGQKQLLCLASVMAMDPDVLILDEPTARLDPIAASEFISTLKKLNEELSLTIIIAEHRLEELIPICDKLIVLEKGRLAKQGRPREVIASLGGHDELLCAMPAAVRLYHVLAIGGECPLTVREGRRFLEQNFENTVSSLEEKEASHTDRAALTFREVYFCYDRDEADVLRGMDLTVYENEIFCILGANGSGKSTALGTAAGLLKAYSGEVRVFGKKLKDYKGQSLYRECLAYLPQDVQTVFLKNTVKEELEEVGARAEDMPFDLSSLYEKHPYDISGGEQQLVALAKALAAKPRLLFLDEPAKGLDAGRKLALIGILKRLQREGITVVIVTHDTEFASLCADRCALFFRGEIVSSGTPEEFFSQNRFYSTAASRMSNGYYERAIRVDDIAELCRRNARRDGGKIC